MAGDEPDNAIIFEEIPYFVTRNSFFYASTVDLGAGPDVFFTFTNAIGGAVSNGCFEERIHQRERCSRLMRSRASRPRSTRASKIVVQKSESMQSRMETWCSLRLMVSEYFALLSASIIYTGGICRGKSISYSRRKFSTSS